MDQSLCRFVAMSFGCIELKDEVYKIEPVRGTNTHRIFKLDPEKAAPIDDGGLVPPRDELPGEMNKIPAIPAGKDDGLVLMCLSCIPTVLQRHIQVTSLSPRLVTWQVWQTPPMQTARSALLRELLVFGKLIIQTMERWLMPLMI